MPGNKKVNSNLNIDGGIKVSTVPNLGTNATYILTQNPSTKEISQRTNSEIISDLNLATTSWVSTNYIPKTHPVYNVTQANIDSWNSVAQNYLGYVDDRIISPNDLGTKKIQFGFTSFTNNNSGPWADFIHFGGYQDASGGNQNLIVFNKTNFGIRQYQGTFQSGTAYTNYVDYWHSGNFNPSNYITKSGQNISTSWSLVHNIYQQSKFEFYGMYPSLSWDNSKAYMSDEEIFYIDNASISQTSSNSLNTFLGKSNFDNNVFFNVGRLFDPATPTKTIGALHLTASTSTNDYASSITFSGQPNSWEAQAGIYVQGSGAYGTKMYFATTNLHADGPKIGMILDSNGNVGIGTTTPNSKLDVNGNIKSNGDITSTRFIRVGGASSEFLKADGSVDTNSYSLSTHTHTFKSITSKPTTLSGYGITDAEYNIPTNTIRNNLGNPTVRETALFHGEFTNKFRFVEATLQEESTDGVNWVTSTRATTNELKDIMIGEGQNGNITAIPSGTVGTYGWYRLTWDVTGIVGYVILNQLYIYSSTNGNNINITIEAYHNTNGWVVITGPHVFNNYPGHTTIPHTGIPYSTNPTHYSKVRITFVSTHNSNTNAYNLQALEWFGGYPAGRRNVESYDRDKNVTFPAKITSTGFKTPSGTPSQFLKADGSVDSNTYVTLNTTQTITGHKLFQALGNEYHSSSIETYGNGSDIFPSIGFHQPGITASYLYQSNDGWLNLKGFGVSNNHSHLRLGEIQVHNRIDLQGSQINAPSIISFLNNGSAQGIKVGGLTVSNSYGDNAPAYGIYSKGPINTNGDLNLIASGEDHRDIVWYNSDGSTEKHRIWQGAFGETTLSYRNSAGTEYPLVHGGNWNQIINLYGMGTSSTPLAYHNLNTIPVTSVSDIYGTNDNRPFSYGSVWTHRKSTTEFTQIAVDVLTGKASTRGWSNGSGDTGWKALATQDWVTSNFANQTLSLGTETEGGQSISLSNGGDAVTITNYFITSRDGSRNVNDASIYPNANPRRVRFDFMSSGQGTGGSGNYMGVMTYSPFDGTTASTGDSSYQLAFINETGINGSGLPGLALRKGIDTTWGSWYNIAHSGNVALSYSGNTLTLSIKGTTVATATINASSGGVSFTGSGTDNGSIALRKSDGTLAYNTGIYNTGSSLYAAAFYETSLKKYKTNIEQFDKSGIELLNELDIVTFDKIDGPKNKIGIIADNSPKEFLSEKEDAVDLYNTIFIQAKAIQELSDTNDMLQARIGRLEEEIQNLRDLLILKLNK